MAACYTGEGVRVMKVGNARDKRTAGEFGTQSWEGPTAMSDIIPMSSRSTEGMTPITPPSDDANVAIPKE